VYWLVAELVDRLRDVVPEGFTVFASTSGSGVEISPTEPPFSGTISYVEEIVEQPHGTFERNVQTAAYNALSSLQDLVVDETAAPWPGAKNELPVPETAVEGGLLHLWYGDRDEPVLALRPIPLPTRPS
jgi:hypothetical protein